MKYVIALIILVFSVQAIAAEPPASFTYQGKLFKANGVDAVEAAAVSFTVQIRSPDGLCLLFEETHLRDMTGTNGVFALIIGEGSNTGAATLNLKQVFDNSAAKVGAAACNYTPVSGDMRRLRFSYNDGTTTVALPNDQTIRSVPYAMNAIALQGMGKDQFIQVNSITTQTKVDTLTGYVTELAALANASSATYVKSSDLPVSGGVLNLSSGGVNVPDSPASASYAINRNYADSRFGGQTLDMSGLANGQTVVWNSATNKWVSRALASSDIPAPAGDVGGTYAAQIVQRLQGVSVSSVAPTANQVLGYNATTLKWEAKNATSLYSFASGNGITVTSGSGAVTVSMAAGSASGHSLNWNGSAWVSGFQNISNMRGQGLAAQIPTNCDAGDTLVYQPAFDTYACTSISIASSQITGSVAGGDMIGSMGAMTVSKLRGVTVSATAPSNLQFLRYNSSTTQWEPTSITLNSGTVTGITAGTGLTGGTISTSGTINVDIGTTAGTVAAGNDSRIVGALQASTVPGGDMSGSMGALTVSKLRGVTVAATAPSNLQFLRYNSSTTQWEPTTVSLNAGTVTNITTGNGLLGGSISITGAISVDAGTTANKIVQLDGSARLPAVDASQLINVPFTNMRVFETAGDVTWTPPATGTKVYVQIWGAGGGGAGGSNALSGGGSGGGGGAYGAGVVTVSGALTITVGAGGTKGIVNAAGSAGGTTNFGSLMTVGGGAGGAVNTSLLTIGGVAGTVLNIAGGLGLPTLGSSGGNGGPAASGGGFGGPGAVAAVAGTAGSAPGGGGGGGFGALLNGKDGGNGANGRVIIWY